MTGDSYHLYLDTMALRPGQSYALCVDYDGLSNGFQVGDSGRRVYVTGVYEATEQVRKASQQVVQLRCRPGECSSGWLQERDVCAIEMWSLDHMRFTYHIERIHFIIYY